MDNEEAVKATPNRFLTFFYFLLSLTFSLFLGCEKLSFGNKYKGRVFKVISFYPLDII